MTDRRTGRAQSPAALLALLAAAACSHARPAVAPGPAPEAAPVAAPRAARPPAALAGRYALQAVIQGRTIPAPPPGRSRGRVVPTPVPSVLQLAPTPLAARDPAVPSTVQLAAVVSLPGYTMPPRGRTTQTAAWWPGEADSITVRWVIAPRNAAVSLRGTLRGDTLSGDVWYTSLASGSEFQIGDFTAVRLPAPRRRTTR